MNKANFDAACTAAGLTTDETVWLWNYLRHINHGQCRKTGVRDETTNPPLAQSGW